jgi:hypothetical protein
LKKRAEQICLEVRRVGEEEEVEAVQRDGPSNVYTYE